MKRRVKWIAGAAVGLAAMGGGVGAVLASGDTETPITGAALGRARAAALDHTQQGRVTETEVGDEDGYYEVEVTLDDGKQVDVHLDKAFNVISQVADEESPNDKDATP